MDIKKEAGRMYQLRNHITIEDTYDYDQRRMFNLDFYVKPPKGQLPLHDLYRIVSDRLKVLKLVFRVANQNYGRPSRQCKMLLVEELKKYNLDDYVTLILKAGFKGNSVDDIRIRKNDHISHFILRMAFAFEQEKKRWFFQQEVRLFKWRLTSLDENSIMAFKSTSSLPLDPIPETEQNEIQEYLDTCNFSTPDGSRAQHFEMRFTEVLGLVKKRRVFIKKGKAFVPLSKMQALFVTRFKDELRSTFVQARQAAVSVCNDERFRSIFQTLPDLVQTTAFAWATSRNLHSKDLDDLSRDNYPLCMRVLHDALRSKHHLTNGGRVQYTLFLKGIGVPMSDTVNFWRDEFLRIMTEKTFRKEHAYRIRHLYGQEGKRMDYAPYSCKKILRSTIGSRDNHGCPYKVMSAEALAQKLQQCGLLEEDVQEVVKLSQEGAYQAACSRYFDITHASSTNPSIEHPNVYFSDSIQLRKYRMCP